MIQITKKDHPKNKCKGNGQTISTTSEYKRGLYGNKREISEEAKACSMPIDFLTYFSLKIF